MNLSSLQMFLESMEKPICEKLNISLCRLVLGVYKKSHISAIRGELGMVPLTIDIVANVMKYKEHLNSKDHYICYIFVFTCLQFWSKTE